MSCDSVTIIQYKMIHESACRGPGITTNRSSSVCRCRRFRHRKFFDRFAFSLEKKKVKLFEFFFINDQPAQHQYAYRDSEKTQEWRSVRGHRHG